MLSRKRQISAVSGLLAALIMTGAGVAQAHDAKSPVGCREHAHRYVTCVHKRHTVRTSKHGKKIIKQVVNCSTSVKNRLMWPAHRLPRTGPTKLVTVVGCSNIAKLP